MDAPERIAEVRGWIAGAHRIVVLTGAGISTESGIPDFRGPQGVWTKNPQAEKLSTIGHYMADPAVRRAAWQARLAQAEREAQPNAGHRALAVLESRGRLHALITQNIDGLHVRAGSSPERVIEVHGTVHDCVCMQCGWRGPMAPVLARVRAGEADPDCAKCGGILKSATISFGQSLVPAVIDRAMQVAAEGDLFMAIGTSLQVYPVADTVRVAKRAGIRVVILNAEPTPFDPIADALLRGRIGAVLSTLVEGKP